MGWEAEPHLPRPLPVTICTLAHSFTRHSSSCATADFLAKALGKPQAARDWGSSRLPGAVMCISCPAVSTSCARNLGNSRRADGTFGPRGGPSAPHPRTGFPWVTRLHVWGLRKEKQTGMLSPPQKKVKIMWTKWKALRKAPRLSAWLIPLAAAGSIWRRTWLWGQQVSLGLFYCLFSLFFFFPLEWNAKISQDVLLSIHSCGRFMEI